MIDPQHELEHLRKMALANPQKRLGKLDRLVKHIKLLTIAGERVRHLTRC